jgi:hypothetical protein
VAFGGDVLLARSRSLRYYWNLRTGPGAFVVKIREGGSVQRKACYLAGVVHDRVGDLADRWSAGVRVFGEVNGFCGIPSCEV